MLVFDPKIFYFLAASVADLADLNLNGTKTLSANGLSTFTIKGKPDFSNSPKSLLKNPSNCIILDSWGFEKILH